MLLVDRHGLMKDNKHTYTASNALGGLGQPVVMNVLKVDGEE